MKALEGMPGVSDVAVFGSGLHLTVRDESAIAQVRQTLQSQRIQVRQLEPIPPSMEDVFVAMIEAEDRKAA
jgi:ABC-2 type transport system ATP-binding protein